MPEVSSSNGRIAKNTVYLYIRMLISMLVSLYTSRVVLDTLGVEDYGIYGVVGGVVGMFSFLNSTMAGATSRFMNFEMGKAREDSSNPRLAETFSSALLIHIGIALAVLILSETIGVWFLFNKLVIPEARMHAAHWVLQFSVIGMAVSVTQVPYSACLIAHEKMDIYAIFELINVGLKLGIVYILVIGKFDKLILYAGLILVVNVLMAMLYRYYCVTHYEESHFHPHLNKEISKGIVSFSLYNLYGNMGWVVNNQGSNFLINMFFGVLSNAGVSVATTVSSTANSFASNISTAFKPPIVKAFAGGDLETFECLMKWAIKAIVIVFSLVAIPVILTCEEVLSIWLVEVPPYATIFTRLMLVSLFFELFKQIIVMGIHACGRVKHVSIISGSLYIVNPLLIYICFMLGFPVHIAYVTFIWINVLLGVIDCFIMKHEIRFISVSGFYFCFLGVIFSLFICAIVGYFICNQFCFDSPFIDIVIKTFVVDFIICIVSFYVVLNKSQRNRLYSFVTKRFGR